MRGEELDAFEAEAQAIEATLGGMPADAWPRPGLGEWSVAELVAHLVRTATRVDAYHGVEVDAHRPDVDRVEYFRVDLEAAAPAIAQRARGEAADVDPCTLARRFADGWRASAARAGGLAADHLLATPHGAMRLDAYLATRVLELVVHHGDLRAALDQPPASTPDAQWLTMHLLEALLGSPRPRNMGRDRFIRAATGRITVDDPRFPVLR
ncbi:MAG: maleylpyruvate isomerase N-terminal domain-containing protein [Egibacteraceae bacterium]